MTASAPASAPLLATAPARFERIALDELFPSPNNPRRIVKKDPKIAELAASLRTLGQIEPIVVRDYDGMRMKYEILAGERRWHAAQLAELPTLECKVIECDDRHALEITVVENLQREQLHPMEESKGVASLLAGGWDVEAIAAHLGKSVRWVQLRAKLVDLTPEWRKAIELEETATSKLTVGHLELIARLSPEVQGQLLAADEADNIFEDGYGGEIITVDDLRELITREYLHDLGSATWPLESAELVPAAGACSACPKRSSCQGTIFEDVTVGGGKKSKLDRCLDVACWKSKVAAFVAQRKVELEDKHEDLVVIKHGSKAENTVSPNAVQIVKKGTPGARPALVADGRGADGTRAGEEVWIKPSSFVREAHDRKVLGLKEEAAGNTYQGMQAKAKKENEDPKHQLALQRLCYVADTLTERLKAKTLKRPSDEIVLRLAIVIGTIEYSFRRAEEIWKDYAKLPAKTPALLEEIWAGLRAQLLDQLGKDERRVDTHHLITKVVSRLRVSCAGIAAVLGVDLEDLEESAENAHPDGPPVLKTKPAAAATSKKGAKRGK